MADFRRPHKISILLPALYGGGAERTMLNLAKGLVSREIPVDLVLARKVGPYIVDVPDDIRIVNLDVKRDLLSIPKLAYYLLHEKPAIMFSGLHMNILAIMVKILLRTKTKIVISERNTISDRLQHFSFDYRMRLMPILIRLFYPHADRVVAVSKSVANELINDLHLSRNLVRVIYNPVITPEFEAKVREKLAHPWFFHGEPPVILSAGRLTAQKNYSTLIKAFSQIRNAHTSRLLILGEGEERILLEQLINKLKLQNIVGLPGFVKNPYPYMVKSNAFVLSSLWEGLPGVLIEAMYCGTRVISTDCPGGSREILNDGKYGRLIPVNNIEALSQSMISAINNEFSPASSESWQPYTLQTIVNQYIDVFHEL